MFDLTITFGPAGERCGFQFKTAETRTAAAQKVQREMGVPSRRVLVTDEFGKQGTFLSLAIYGCVEEAAPVNASLPTSREEAP